MTATDNLWPEFPLDEVIRSPKTILIEQADFLAKRTKNILQAEIKAVTNSKNYFRYEFVIIAPNLNGYRYNLFFIEQESIFFYPCKFFGEFYAEITSEEDLINVLRDIFNDDSTKKVISALISQSKSESPI